MSLTISNGLIGTNPPVHFPNKSIVLSSSGISATDGSGGISLNTPASSLNISANGIVTPSGLSLAPISSAPSTSASGFSVSGLVNGVKPAKPTITSVVLPAGFADRLQINFSLSSINSGSPINSLTFYAYIGNAPHGTPKTTTDTSSPFSFTGLLPNQTYRFRMTANNDSLQSELSDASNDTLLAEAPDPPTIQSVWFKDPDYANRTGQWILSFAPPTNTGSSPLDFSQTQFQIRKDSTHADDGTSVVNPFTHTPEPYYPNLLAVGHGYTFLPSNVNLTSFGEFQFYVRVQNTNGTYSQWSAFKNLVYPVILPSNIITNIGNDGKWSVSWNISSTVVSRYDLTATQIDIKLNNASITGAPFTNAANTGPSTHLGVTMRHGEGFTSFPPTISPLPAPGTYTVLIRAKADGVFSAWTSPVQMEYQPGVPDAPYSLAVSSASGSDQYSLSFEMNARGTTINRFQVEIITKNWNNDGMAYPGYPAYSTTFSRNGSLYVVGTSSANGSLPPLNQGKGPMEFRVMAETSEGVFSSWSSPQYVFL